MTAVIGKRIKKEIEKAGDLGMTVSNLIGAMREFGSEYPQLMIHVSKRGSKKPGLPGLDRAVSDLQYSCELIFKKASVTGPPSADVGEATIRALGTFIMLGFKLAAQSRGYDTDEISMLAYLIIENEVRLFVEDGDNPYDMWLLQLPDIDHAIADRAIAALSGE